MLRNVQKHIVLMDYFTKIPFMKKSKYVLVSLITVKVLGLYFLLNRPTYKDPDVTGLQERPFSQNKVKTILLWSALTSDIGVLEKQYRDCLSTCNVKCAVTTDKSTLPTSDIIVFEMLKHIDSGILGTKTIHLPDYRTRDQVWVVHNMEPPVNMKGNLGVLNGIFNWTAWHRKDATIHHPYGSMNKLNQSETIKATAAHKGLDVYSTKELGIVGLVSNCHDQSGRLKLIHELRQYLDIDMFGSCYNKICGIASMITSCIETLERYKFNLAFENSHCRDYVTEKYWHTIYRKQIPIVNWKYSTTPTNVIPNSYINIYDFKDIKSAANYIKRVADNATLYNSYFDWKRQYVLGTDCLACSLCQAGHDTSRRPQVIHDLNKWVLNDTCEKQQPMKKMINDIRAKMFWKLEI